MEIGYDYLYVNKKRDLFIKIEDITHFDNIFAVDELITQQMNF